MDGLSAKSIEMKLIRFPILIKGYNERAMNGFYKIVRNSASLQNSGVLPLNPRRVNNEIPRPPETKRSGLDSAGTATGVGFPCDGGWLALPPPPLQTARAPPPPTSGVMTPGDGGGALQMCPLSCHPPPFSSGVARLLGPFCR